MTDTASTSKAYIKTGQLRYFLHLLWYGFFGIGFVLCALGFAYRFMALGQFENSEFQAFLPSFPLKLFPLEIYFVVLDICSFLTVSLLAVLIMWRRSDDWVALLMSIAIFYANIGQSYYSAYVSLVAAKTFHTVGYLPLIAICCVLPTGQFIPRFTRPLLPFLLLGLLLSEYYIAWLMPPDFIVGRLLADVVIVGIFAVGVFAQHYRYKYVATASQRQQTKWIVSGGFAYISLLAFVYLIPPIFPDFFFPPNSLFISAIWEIVLGAVKVFGLTAMAFALFFSILRYRLWEIDLVINRSIVGFSVSIVLLLIFIAGVFLVQNFIGAENLLVSYGVSGTLAAFMFKSVHKQVRQFVDRRLYGLNFDLNELRAAQKKPEIKNAGALTGKRLGAYEVLDFLGKGGMGEVYKGYTSGRTVAIKTMLEHFAKEQDFMRRFQREAEVMQSLKHPKIVKLYEAGENEGLHYLAMEFIEGTELKAFLREKGKVSMEDAKEILCDLAAALDYLHERDIVHRDIKPSNVMLRSDERLEAILMDFGIAKIEDGKTRLTGSGAIGTIDYMSPEQILAAKEVDRRSDIYALGVIAYEMLTGERPFEGNAAQVMFAHLQKPVTDPRQHRSDLSETVSSAILKALEKQPEDRFESAGAFVGALL